MAFDVVYSTCTKLICTSFIVIIVFMLGSSLVGLNISWYSMDLVGLMLFLPDAATCYWVIGDKLLHLYIIAVCHPCCAQPLLMVSPHSCLCSSSSVRGFDRRLNYRSGLVMKTSQDTYSSKWVLWDTLLSSSSSSLSLLLSIFVPQSFASTCESW